MKNRFFILLFMVFNLYLFADIYSIGEFAKGDIPLDDLVSYNDVTSLHYNTSKLDSNIEEKVFTLDEDFFREEATIYSPKAEGVYPTVIITHGYNSSKEPLSFYGKHLATHGYVCIVYTNANQKMIFQWPNGFIAAYNILVSENLRKNSIIYNKVDFSKIAIMGHSMGGAGALQTAARFLKDKVDVVIGLSPYNGGPTRVDAVGGANFVLGDDLSPMIAPTLIISGTWDWIAHPGMSYKFYEKLPNSIPKVFVSLNRLGHDLQDSALHIKNKKGTLTLITAWLNLYLKGEKEYKEYFTENGEAHIQMVADKYFRAYNPGVTNTYGKNPCPAYIVSGVDN